MMDARADAFASDNLGWHLETLVYIELLRRNGPKEQDIYYYKNDKGIETDFVVCKGNKALELYQVCYDLSSEKTRTREINSLLTGAKATRCNNLYIITDFQSETITHDGRTIKIVPAHEWLLNE
jgi:predicted AAA+ superfamily ATPase